MPKKEDVVAKENELPKSQEKAIAPESNTPVVSADLPELAKARNVSVTLLPLSDGHTFPSNTTREIPRDDFERYSRLKFVVAV